MWKLKLSIVLIGYFNLLDSGKLTPVHFPVPDGIVLISKLGKIIQKTKLRLVFFYFQSKIINEIFNSPANLWMMLYR